MQYSAEPPVHKSHHFKLTPSPSVPALQARKAIRLAIDCRSFGNTNASKRPVSAEWKIQSSVVSETNGGGQLAANKGNFSTAASISRRNDGAFLQRVAAAVTSQVQSLSYYIDYCITAVPAMEPIFRDQDTACFATVGVPGRT